MSEIASFGVAFLSLLVAIFALILSDKAKFWRGLVGFVCFVLAVVFGYIGFSSVANSRTETSSLPVATATQTVKQEKAIIAVRSDRDWQNTGIRPKDGATIAITYISGQWSVCATHGCPFVGPGGWTSSDRWKTPEESRNYADNVIPGCPHAALIARFSGYPAFCAEGDMIVAAPTQSTLEFRINDSRVTDNEGDLRVQVEIR